MRTNYRLEGPGGAPVLTLLIGMTAALERPERIMTRYFAGGRRRLFLTTDFAAAA